MNVPFISQHLENQGLTSGNLQKHSIIRIRHHPKQAELVGILGIECHFNSLDLVA